MIQSMTGFGRASVASGNLRFEIEARSVNHRYLESRVKLPHLLAALEADLRARIQQRFSRGKIDVSVTTPGGGTAPQRLEVDLETARGYLRAAEELRKTEKLSGKLEVDELLALPGVAKFVELEELDDALRREFLVGFDAALDALASMRAAEGEALERDLLARLAQVETLARSLEERAGTVAEAARARLRKRAEQIAQETGLFDEARLHQEIVIAADRGDVAEELVRMKSHVEQFRSTVQSGGPGQPVGRQLDFLLQELGRETNTIGSKAGDAPLAHQIVELKGELERLREQVQNVE